MIDADAQHEEAERTQVMADFFDTTKYVGQVEDWEQHAAETEESEDEPSDDEDVTTTNHSTLSASIRARRDGLTS